MFVATLNVNDHTIYDWIINLCVPQHMILMHNFMIEDLHLGFLVL